MIDMTVQKVSRNYFPSRAGGGNVAVRLKPRQLSQFLEALLDGVTGDAGGEFQAEAFAAERSHHAAVDHRATQIVLNRTFRRREVTHHAPYERIARAGGIHHPMKRI